jgi:predicted enzyme related to lactoylglutathione lyase
MPELMFILYVRDQQKSKDFYKSLLNIEPQLDVPGMTEFKIAENVVLGLMPESGIERVLGKKVPSPSLGKGIPRSEIYFPVDSPADYLIKLEMLGGKAISNAELRNWGHVVAYGADLDGHIIAFAKSK